MIKPQSRYIQWFYDKLVPNKHFVLVKNDLSDLVLKLECLKRNDAKSLEIIKDANICIKLSFSISDHKLYDWFAFKVRKDTTIKTYWKITIRSSHKAKRNRLNRKNAKRTWTSWNRSKTQLKMEICNNINFNLSYN